MILGIADICLLDHLGAGMTRNDFVRRAAALGVQAASVRLLAGDEGADPVIAAEVGVELEFRTGTVDPGELSDCIRRAHALGASFLRTMPSGRYHYNDSARQSHAIAMAIAGLRAVVPLLDELDMTLGVENHADVTSPELIAIIEAVDSARVRVLLDLGNSIQIFENPRYTIEQLAPYTVALHVKDLVIGQRLLVQYGCA